MATQATLLELAEEHLKRMVAVPWATSAASIAEGKAGETFGCEVDGRYFDVGDRAKWMDKPNGDILLICHAGTADGCRIERQSVIRRR